MPSPEQPQSENPRVSLKITVVATIVITALVTGLTMLLGGFGSQGTDFESAQRLSVPIQIHLWTALPALVLGPVVLLRRKGDKTHRWLGRLWVSLMLVTAVASAFIRAPGAGLAGSGFSLIHIFTIWTLVNAPLGVWLARKGRVRAHRGAMTGLYAGLVIAGAFTLIPGRLIGNLVFA